jgi:hypothetical protein
LVDDYRHALISFKATHIVVAIVSYRLFTCNFHDCGSTFVELVQHRNLRLFCITDLACAVSGLVAGLAQQVWFL